MGGNACKEVKGNFQRDPIKFWKDVGDEIITQDAKERVKLTFKIKNCVQTSSYKISFYTYEFEHSYEPKETFDTIQMKPSSQDLTITFPECFVMDYFFEKQQYIGFNVQCNSIPNTIKATLANIMGARGQKFESKIDSGEVLEVNGKGIKSNNNMKLQIIVNANGNFTSEICYLIKSYNNIEEKEGNPIYKSETLNIQNCNLPFETIEIPSIHFNNLDINNYEENIIGIEVFYARKKIKLGEYKKNIKAFLLNVNEIQIKGKGIITITCKQIINAGFLDYLRGGTQIALTLGIDFTASNGLQTSPQSLHYISENSLNSYEKAIKSCGEIVAHYDYDQLIPVYGYGACPPYQEEVSMCFPLTNSSDPNIYKIEGVLRTYREVLPSLYMNGPTHFSPLIRQFNRNVKEEMKINPLIYNILMILTDGQIQDMPETKDELVEASFLPISVIIIGIGKGPFENMDILDADIVPLYDKNGRKAARDLVQFVPFMKYENNGVQLAEQVLEEVPRQVCDYYKMNNILPRSI